MLCFCCWLDIYNISNGRGRVCRLILFKNNFKLGEDILGTLDFDHTDVPCVQFTVTLQSEEVLNSNYRRKSTQTSNINSFTKQTEFSLSTAQSYLSLSIPLSCSPTFSMDLGNSFRRHAEEQSISIPVSLVSLRWKLHFEFVISKTAHAPVPSNNDPSASSTWSTANSIDAESMIWDLPIKILPTNPYFANNVAKVACTAVVKI